MGTVARQDKEHAVNAAIDQQRMTPPNTGCGDDRIAASSDAAPQVIIGKNIRISRFNVPRWLPYVVGVDCAVLLLFAALSTPEIGNTARGQALIIKCPYPLEMGYTQFNGVMTPFTTVGGDGPARALFRYRQTGLGQNSSASGKIRSPERSCALADGKDVEQLADTKKTGAQGTCKRRCL